MPTGTIRTPNGLLSGLWALPRPLTKHWGSGQIMKRISDLWNKPDLVLGKQDQVDGFTVDHDENTNPSIVAKWEDMPFSDKKFSVAYWDPPYLGYVGKDGDVHYNRLDPCLREICRVTKDKLFILSPLIYPCPKGWHRIAVIAITMGPNKIIRSLQGFQRDQ